MEKRDGNDRSHRLLLDVCATDADGALDEHCFSHRPIVGGHRRMSKLWEWVWDCRGDAALDDFLRPSEGFNDVWQAMKHYLGGLALYLLTRFLKVQTLNCHQAPRLRCCACHHRWPGWRGEAGIVHFPGFPLQGNEAILGSSPPRSNKKVEHNRIQSLSFFLYFFFFLLSLSVSRFLSLSLSLSESCLALEDSSSFAPLPPLQARPALLPTALFSLLFVQSSVPFFSPLVAPLLEPEALL